jgi:MFS family permease
VLNDFQVSWESGEDPENPKNWTYRKKWAATLIVSAFTFISPVSSSMVAPALNTIGEDLGINNDIEKSLTLSIFVLAYAIGPLFLGPLSEIFGRVIVLQLSNLFFLAFNIGCGFAQSKGQLIAFRFLSGLGGSAPLSLGGGVLSDVWHTEERGKSISIYSLAPLLGPAGKQDLVLSIRYMIDTDHSWTDRWRFHSREGESVPSRIVHV